MRFAELVFHVLAHVPGNVAASVYDPRYVAFVEAHAGPASGRMLGEDVALLARVLDDHDTLVRVQMLAWLFHGASRAPADRALGQLEDVDDRTALAILVRPGIEAVAEIVRAAAELEADAYAELPLPTIGSAPLDARLLELRAAAPHLAACSVECLMPLRLRGRVRGRAIWVGAPSVELGLTVEHAAWQAAHEATVAEVSERAQAAGIGHAHDGLEHAALVLLHERARACGLGDAHAVWLAHLRGLPAVERSAVPEAFRALLNR